MKVKKREVMSESRVPHCATDTHSASRQPCHCRTAIDAFRDAQEAFTDLLKTIKQEGTGTTTEHGAAASDALASLSSWLSSNSASLAELKKSARVDSGALYVVAWRGG